MLSKLLLQASRKTGIADAVEEYGQSRLRERVSQVDVAVQMQWAMLSVVLGALADQLEDQRAGQVPRGFLNSFPGRLA